MIKQAFFHPFPFIMDDASRFFQTPASFSINSPEPYAWIVVLKRPAVSAIDHKLCIVLVYSTYIQLSAKILALGAASAHP
jgi:hypothetical protein